MTNVIARVKNLLLSPKTEWDAIDQEAAEPRKLIIAFVAPLAFLPAAATVIGLSVLGVDVGGEVVRAPWIWVAASASLFFVLAILGVVAFAFVLDRLAPMFGAARNYAQAFKVSAYSITAAMVAGLATVVPALGVVALIGAAYSLYLLFLGAPRLMRPAPESALNYAIVATACAIGLGLVVGLAAMAAVAPSARMLFPQIARLPGLAAKPPPGPLAAAAAAAGAPTTAATIPKPTPAIAPSGLVSTSALKAIAPEKLVGLDRVALGIEASGLANAQSVSLDAEFRKGKRYIDLTIVHSTTIAAVIGFGGSATSEYDRETAEGYSRRKREGGNVIVEEWNRASASGSYGRLSGDEFYVRASGGGGITAEELKQAVEVFSAEQLAKLERTP